MKKDRINHVIHYPLSMRWLPGIVEEIAREEGKSVSDFLRDCVIALWKDRHPRLREMHAKWLEVHGRDK